MAVIPFKHSVSSSYNSRELAWWIGKQNGIIIDEDLREKIGNPFDEIVMDCTLDTETGEVKVLKFHF